MAYQNPNTGEWLNDDGSPLYSYLPQNFGAYNDPANTPPPVAPTAVTPPAGGDGNGNGGEAPGSGFHPLQPENFPWNMPARVGLPELPGVGAAPSFDFKAPTIEEALSDPSYQFRRSQGEGSLQRWAAAKGTLNDSSTAEALINYGQNAATQEYSNIWNRKLQVARDAYAPLLSQWEAQNQRAGLGYTTQAGYNQHLEDMDLTALWNKRLSDIDLGKWNAEGALKYA